MEGWGGDVTYAEYGIALQCPDEAVKHVHASGNSEVAQDDHKVQVEQVQVHGSPGLTKFTQDDSMVSLTRDENEAQLTDEPASPHELPLDAEQVGNVARVPGSELTILTTKQNKADASVQVCNTSSGSQKQYASVSCQAWQGDDAAGEAAAPQGRQRHKQDAAVQHNSGPDAQDDADGDGNHDAWTLRCSEASPACALSMLANTSQISYRVRQDRHPIAPVQDNHEASVHVPPCRAMDPRLSIVSAPDPGTLLAVQDVRAQLEALNREMASAMRSPSSSLQNTQEVGLALKPGISKYTSDREDDASCTDKGEHKELLVSVVTDEQRRADSESQPYRDEGSESFAKPIRINVSVVTEFSDKIKPGAVSWHACSPNAYRPVEADLYMNMTDHLSTGQHTLVKHEHKACQAVDDSEHQTRVQPASRPQIAATVQEVELNGAASRLDQCGDVLQLHQICHDFKKCPAQEFPALAGKVRAYIHVHV